MKKTSEFPEEFSPRGAPVEGSGGMVASSQPLATAAGIEILSRGGNAADAAVATAAALNVTEPTSTGLGGDMFALFYEAATGRITALNGSGRAPASLTLESLHQNGLKDLPPFHPYTITVPGACAGWCDLVECHGSMDLADILAPAIRLAKEGFAVERVSAHFWQQGAERQLKNALNGSEMTLDGRGPNPGEIFHNPALAQTLEMIALGGRKAFYQGEIARRIASTVRQAGGCLSEADLEAHESTWDEPLSASHAGLSLWECPPNGQGIVALLALHILEGFSLPPDPLDTERLHLEIEALRLAFADALWYIADPRQATIPLEELLSREYASRRRTLIHPRSAALQRRHGRLETGTDTVYFCVVDGHGNACSFINSNYMGFGTGIVPHGLGFTLQNRGHNFSLKADHPNVLAPGKRPYHTIIPGMITREADGSLFGPMGVMGGFMQPQGHLQLFLALAQGFDPQATLDMPRFCIEVNKPGWEVALETGIPEKAIQGLKERGHRVRVVTGWERALFGRGQVILRDPGSGTLRGGSDPRADGCARALISGV